MNEKIINNEHEISKLIKALPKDIAALDKRSVLANVNSQGSGKHHPIPEGTLSTSVSLSRDIRDRVSPSNIHI